MSRLQLALNVSEMDAAVAFYSKLFGTEPAKRRPGYANFAIAEPPLKLVLFENPAATGKLNHLGIEVESSEKVVAASDRLKQSHLAVRAEPQTTCCYALQDKIWVSDPDGDEWEVYTVLQDSPTFACGGAEIGSSC
jgi:catechol 2,3-dioxygenase-like lactoylglutathione lyase family enzyme